jgi:hypothetical protein
MYTPGPFPSGKLTNEQIMEIVFRELQEIARASAFSEDLILSYLHAEPSKTVAGMIVNADGSDWNPGSGAGTYRRNEANSAWVFLG